MLHACAVRRLRLRSGNGCVRPSLNQAARSPGMVKQTDRKARVPLQDRNDSEPSPSTAPPSAASGEPGFEFDLEPLRDLLDGLSLIRPPKFPVGTTVPERVYLEILSYRPGISQFIEDAITGFNGDIRTLVEAAAQISAERKTARFDTGVRSISGRVPKAALTRLQGIVGALREIPGMSLAKVLGGLVYLKLSRIKE